MCRRWRLAKEAQRPSRAMQRSRMLAELEAEGGRASQ